MHSRTVNARHYGDLTSAEVAEAVEGATLVWPIGGLEQHGPHLPLSVDLDIPQALGAEIATATGGLLLPALPISARSLPHSGGGLHLSGTVFLRGNTLIDTFTDTLTALARLRPGRLIIVNGHYENEGLLFEAIDGCRPTEMFPDTEILAFSWWSLVADGWIAEHLPAFPGWHAEHAGVTETSLMMYLRPETVRPERPGHDTPPRPGVYVHPLDVAKMSNGGVLSSTVGASRRLGQKLFRHLTDSMCDMVRSGLGVACVLTDPMTASLALQQPTSRSELPTVIVCNAVDTLRGIAERAPAPEAADRIIAECFSQQDQALFWGPDEKLVITSRPIQDLAWQTRFLGLPDIVNLSPATDSGSLFADLIGDDRLLANLLEYVGPGRRFQLIPHTTTPDLWAFVDLLRLKYGVVAELPESCRDQGLRDLLDTKSGLRTLVAEAGLTRTACTVARGRTCTDRDEALAAVDELLSDGTPCIVKADKGEAGVGLLIFRPGDDASTIVQALKESTFYGADPIVVEEYIDRTDSDDHRPIAFPSVEYVVPDDPSREPVLTHVCDMLFDGATVLRGNVASASLAEAAWYEPFVAASTKVAQELQCRGYKGHFGIDAVARGGEVYMLDLNARRTGSTHVHDFGVRLLGPDYLKRHTVGNYDFYGLPRDSTLADVLARLGPLVRAPGQADSGVVPCELSGLAAGRLSCLIHAPTLAAFHDLVQQVRDALQRD